MDEMNQQLIDAAMRYVALLEDGQNITIAQFVAQQDPALQSELGPYLEEVVAFDPTEPLAAETDEDHALDALVAAHFDALVRDLTGAQIPRTLGDARQARNLSLRDVATQLDVPVPFIARLERGGVALATLPQRFRQRLAAAIGQVEASVQQLLAGPQLAPGGVRLSAQDGTEVKPEEAIAFMDALRASGASERQLAEWS